MAFDVIQHSVTKDDYEPTPKNGSVYNFWVPGSGYSVAGLPVRPPRFWSRERDNVLSATIHFESMWAGSVYTAISRLASLNLKFKGPALRARHLRELMLAADDGRGWTAFIEKHLRDFLLRDNGAFIEIVRATSGATSKIVGLVSLDSYRCIRTGNRDIPVLYEDKLGKYHELRDHQVIYLADMPSPDERWHGLGMCAASRAYDVIYTTAALENYIGEKITGRRVLSLNFINSVNMEQLEGAIGTAEQQRANKGFASFMGAVVIPQIDPESTPQVATIQLAGLPEGWTPEVERRKAYLAYAKALGVDPQDIDPQLLASRALGTGAQARVIDDKASGQGLASWPQQFFYLINEYVSPQETTCSFSESDYRDQLQQEAVTTARVNNVTSMIQNGMILPEQGTQLLVDQEVIPPEFLPIDDVTNVEELSGNQKPRNSKKPASVLTSDGEAGMQSRNFRATPDMRQDGQPNGSRGKEAQDILDLKWAAAQQEQD